MAFFGKPKTEEGKNEKEKQRFHEEIGKYLLEGEEVVKSFGLIDKAYLTEKRVIFKDKNLSFSDKTLEEMVFIPLKNINSVSIVTKKGIVAPNEVIINCKGVRHSMRFGHGDLNVLDFVKTVSAATV